MSPSKDSISYREKRREGVQFDRPMMMAMFNLLMYVAERTCVALIARGMLRPAEIDTWQSRIARIEELAQR